MKCLIHSLMSVYVCKLADRYLNHYTKYISICWYENYVCALFLSIRVGPFYSQSKYQLTCDVKTLFYMHIYLVSKSNSTLKKTPQINYCSNQVQESFPLHLQTQNNILILTAHSWLLTQTSFDSHNTVWLLDIGGYIWSSQQSNCSLRKLQKSHIHVNSIQTAVKKNITMIFSEVNPVILQSINFVTRMRNVKNSPSSHD